MNPVPRRSLLLVGGGDVSPAAVQWLHASCLKSQQSSSTSNPPKILVFAWASGSPEASFDARREGLLSSFDAAGMMASLRAPRGWAELRELARQIRGADALFFNGGDQQLYAEAFDRISGLRDTLREFYASGRAVAGTSAGTAIMSRPMIERDAIAGPLLSARGLGILDNCIVDQHFLRRSREARLLAAMRMTRAPLGIGVEEDAALTCVDEEWVEAVGGPVCLYAGETPSLAKRLEPGVRFRLSELPRVNLRSHHESVRALRDRNYLRG